MMSICTGHKAVGAYSKTGPADSEKARRYGDRQRNDTIEAMLREDQRKQASIFRLLLLGAGESGKSTIVKQMRILHASGFSKEDIAREQSVIAENMLASMIAMLDAMVEKLQMIRDVETADHQLEADMTFVRSIQATWEDGRRLEPGEWAALKRLWQHETVQACFKRANEYQLNDSTKYFFDDIDRISASNYSPTEQDILRARVRTTGVVELALPLRNLDVRIIDVGGQRSERRKWVHCFEGVNSIIFVASLSEYNQMLFEDNAVNRMHESLRLFATIVNSRWFAKSSMILFLNKKDIFQEKIKEHPLRIASSSYDGPNTYEAASQYIESRYVLKKLDFSRQLYCHFTCATDTTSIDVVMNACFDTIFSEVMEGVALY